MAIALREYNRKQTSLMLDIPALRLKFFTDEGLCPWVSVKTGKGNERKYSQRDVVFLAIVKEMWEAGISLATLKTFVNQCQNHENMSMITARVSYSITEIPESLHLVITGYSSKQYTFDLHNSDIVTIKPEAVSTMIFNLRRIASKIDWQI